MKAARERPIQRGDRKGTTLRVSLCRGLTAALASACMTASSSSGQIRGLPYFYDVLSADQDWSIGLLGACACASDEDLPEDQRESVTLAGFLRSRLAGRLTVAASAGIAFGNGAVGHGGAQADWVLYDPHQWTISLVGGGAYSTSPADRADMDESWSVDTGGGLGIAWSPSVDVTPLQLWAVPRYTNRVTKIGVDASIQHGLALSAGFAAYLAKVGLSVGVDIQYLQDDALGAVPLRDGVDVRVGAMIRYSFTGTEHESSDNR